jgi:hypothetical protein
MQRRRILRSIGVGAVALIIVVIGTAWFSYRRLWPDICHDERRFSIDAWARLGHAPMGAPDRACLVDDLLAQGVLRGRSRTQVDSLLGPAPQTLRTPEVERTYYLGPERGPFGIDSQLLVLMFDSAGRVSHVARRRD